MSRAEAFIAQWKLANEMLDQLEWREKEEAFDLMLAAAIELGRAGYQLHSDGQWYDISEGSLDAK